MTCGRRSRDAGVALRQPLHTRTLAVDAADVATTQFNLPPEKQELLIGNGRKAAKAFLDAFRLEDYMNTFHAPLATTAAIRRAS